MKYVSPQITPQEPKRANIVLGLEIAACVLALDSLLALGITQFSAAMISFSGAMALFGFAKAIRYLQLILWRLELSSSEEKLRALNRETEVLARLVRKAEQEEPKPAVVETPARREAEQKLQELGLAFANDELAAKRGDPAAASRRDEISAEKAILIEAVIRDSILTAREAEEIFAEVAYPTGRPVS